MVGTINLLWGDGGKQRSIPLSHDDPLIDLAVLIAIYNRRRHDLTCDK